MFHTFSDVIAAINDLKERGFIQDYAIFGAIAQMFWDEAIATWDLDVLVLPGTVENVLAPRGPIHTWATERGYVEQAAHIVISGVPVQFLPAPDTLAEEAVNAAAVKELNGVPMKVVRPEYLIALWLQPPANTHGRKERAAKLRESAPLDEALLADLMARYHLSW
jgi:hypothetical protein